MKVEADLEMAVRKVGLVRPLWVSVSSPITLGPIRSLPAPTVGCAGSSGRLGGSSSEGHTAPWLVGERGCK